MRVKLLTSVNKCKSAKNDGRRCTRDALKWSEFCWQHQPREVWIPAVVTMIVGVVLGFAINVVTTRVLQFASQRDVNLARGRAIPMIRGFPVILSTGGGHQIVTGPGYYPPGVKGRPFSVMVGPDRTIRVYGEIRNQSGIIVVQAEGDFVRALPGGGYDINSDRRAIEVVDEKRMPVFQLRIRSYTEWNESLRETDDRMFGELTGVHTPDEPREMLLSMLRQQPPIQPQADQNLLSRESLQMFKRYKSLQEQAQEVLELNYVTATDETWLVATPQGSKECVDLQEVESLRANIERIFEYPGHRYPGKRALATKTGE